MITENNRLNLLVVEDNASDYELLKEYLQLTKLPVRNIFHAARMSEVPVLTDADNIDIVLLDLSLPDSTGIDSVIKLNRLFPKTPIVVLSGLSSIEIAMEAISLGAQDYLVKGEFDEKLLFKTLQYSIERKRIFENLQQSKERYEFVNKATLDAIWEYDFNTDTGKWGEGITLFGYSRDLNLNQDSWQLVHPDDFQRVNQHLAYCIDNKIETWQDEYRLRTNTGDYKDVFGRAYILFNDEGKPYRMFGAITDITERKRLEKELLTQKIEQQKMITDVTILAQEKERNELGKELHDNINQILATVKIYMSVVRNNQKEPDELIEKSYEYLNQAMEEIRKLSKTLVSPSLGGDSLKESLTVLINEVNLVEPPLIILNYEIEENELTDERKQLTLYRIIQEQITNIRKHAQASQVIITITSGDENVLLTIEDNGVGFDTSKKVSGIGLQNISSRVEFYSGKMNITSEPHKGCKIEIKLPI